MAGTTTTGHELALDTQGIVADHVRITCQTNWGDPEAYYGLGEVRFYGSEVPEPSTLLGLLVLGLAGLACRWRR